MERINLSEIMSLGGNVRFLMHSNSNYSIKGEGLILENLTRLYDQIDSLGFQVSKAATWEQKRLSVELEQATEGQNLTQMQAQRLTALMEKMEFTIDAEASTKGAYILADKRMPIDGLVNDVGQLIAKRGIRSTQRSTKV